MISRLILNLQDPSLFETAHHSYGRTEGTDTNIGPFVTTLFDRDASFATQDVVVAPSAGLPSPSHGDVDNEVGALDYIPRWSDERKIHMDLNGE